MTTLTLFHRPTMEFKLSHITCATQLQALLAAMFSFSMYHLNTNDQAARALSSTTPEPSTYYFKVACKLIAKALEECSDETPPLCLLQALIITTFQQLINGVRGRSWRALGQCVRIAYELQLHVVDLDDDNENKIDQDIQSHSEWVLKEERRRAWWQIWEFDVFASTIRRLPTALDWTLMKTKLPMPDEKWFNDEDCASCYFVVDPAQRWKELEKSGNRSAKAWFVLINSYMRDAHLLASFPGSSTPNSGRSVSSAPTDTGAQRAEVMTRNFRDLLSNSLTCALIAMPSELVYHDEYLAFRATANPFAPASQFNESSKYSIHIMVQLTRFMLHTQNVFRTTSVNASTLWEHHRGSPQDRLDQKGPSAGDREAWEHYVDAADKIVKVVRNSSQEHVRYVNPFLANTIWLAAAAQVVARLFGPPSIDRRLAASNFDVLRGTLNLYVSFWGICGELKTKLDNLEYKLDQVRRASEAETPTIGQAARSNFRPQSPTVTMEGRSTQSSGFSNNHPASGTLTPIGGMQMDSSDPLLGFNGGASNLPDFTFSGNDFFDNLGLELDDLFTYPYQ